MPDNPHEILTLEPMADDSEIGRWLAALEDARRDTLLELKAVTATILDWRPPLLLDSIGTVLYHIALVESSWLLDEIFAGEEQPDWLPSVLPFPDRDAEDRLTHVGGEPLDGHLQRLARIRGYFVERVRELENADFHTLRRLERYDVAPDWVLHHLLQHEAEHRSHIAFVRDWYLATDGA